MDYRRLGASGLHVSAIGLGGWTTFGSGALAPEDGEHIVRAAFDAGINFFDIADVYAQGECERSMGRVLKTLPRHRLVIASKVYWPMSDDVNDRGLSRKHIVESVDKSLARIGVDYLDLYFCHRYDDDVRLDETLRAMDDLVRAGKILYWGTSCWTGAHLKEAHALADARSQAAPVAEQPEYGLMCRDIERALMRAAQEAGMGLLVWGALASGVLTGKYKDGIPKGSRLDRIEWLRDTVLTDEHRAQVDAFVALAAELGAPPARVALAWALSRPGVSSVITGASSVAQLEENLTALSLPIDDALGAKLDAIFPAA